ncbi:FAD dependent oxidoreductase [Xylaria sp. CBS 124048]|nr:FAD dependent oxidoreductase [Xylaria sp. CBS 124048]
MMIPDLSPEAQARRAELPSPNSTHSYWHRDPSKKLWNHRTTEDLPETADVLVIGSGISGAFAARELVAGGRSVTMLEAREACWGATGRNGGHCQPLVWASTAEVARFELATFELVKSLIGENSIPCDWHVVGGLHAIYTQDVLDAARAQMKRLQNYPDLRDKAVLIEDRETLIANRIPAAIGAILQPNAAKLWPYKLVAWLLEALLAGNAAPRFNLQTNTPVARLERDGSRKCWIAHTPRGAIAASDVLVCTNGYTSYLLPGLTDVIVPVRGQVCALEPPGDAGQLGHSYVWTSDASDQYLVHRSLEDTQVPGAGKKDRSLILGGERFADPAGEEGISRDDAINPAISQALHSALKATIKLRPGEEPEEERLKAEFEWTGIMGYSRDDKPWVGRVPLLFLGDDDLGEAGEVGGLWISAGFTGHGMPVAPRCGVAVAEMILGKGEDEVKVPEGWMASEGRAARARGMEFPRTLVEVLRSLPSE